MKISGRVIWAAMLGLTAVASACGSSSTPKAAPTVATTSTTSASSTSVTTMPGVNVAAEQARAQSVNLASADLPGWQASPNPKTATDQAMSARLAQCTGAPNPSNIDVVDVNSPDFDKGETEVSSNVTIVRTPADDLATLQAVRSSRLTTCLQQIAVPYLQSKLPSGAKVVNLNINRLTLSSLPSKSFAYRLAVTISIPGQGNVLIVSDTVGFVDGVTAIGLDITQTAGTPDATLEDQLISTLVTSEARSSSANVAPTSTAVPTTTARAVDYGQQFLADVTPWNAATARINGAGFASPAARAAGQEAAAAARALLAQSWPPTDEADIHNLATQFEIINEDIEADNLAKFENDGPNLNAAANVVRADFGLPAIG